MTLMRDHTTHFTEGKITLIEIKLQERHIG